MLGSSVLQGAAESTQRKAAKLAYDIYKSVSDGKLVAGAKVTVRSWQHLTQVEQEEWIGAAGDVIKERIG